MGTTRSDIQAWFRRGQMQEAAYMIVWCDTYDYEDYPAYHKTAEACQEDLNTDGTNMKRAMECYDLHNDMETQLKQTRAWAMRPKRGGS